MNQVYLIRIGLSKTQEKQLEYDSVKKSFVEFLDKTKALWGFYKKDELPPRFLKNAHRSRWPARRGHILGLGADQGRRVPIGGAEFGLTLQVRVVPLLL